MRMNLPVVTTMSATALLLAGCTSTTPEMADGPAVLAGAALSDAQGASKGDLSISKIGDGLRLTLRASGISPGVHGVHVHMVGSCVAPDFTSAGAHWNPIGKQHGMQNPAGPHEGDLPNIEIGADGTGTLTATIPGTLSDGANPMLDTDGAAIVIHAGPDDMKTDPSGNSGGRIACGVITQR